VGSSPENYVRHKLNIDIPLKLPGAEVIVGVNNQSILKDGYEVDIPIIILYKNNIYKYAVEVDGDYWHSSELRIQKDMKKQEELSLSNYKMFRVIQTTHSSIKNIYGSIDEQIESISNSIANQVLYSLTP
jgi:very-short-patch-repair endonuclease